MDLAVTVTFGVAMAVVIGLVQAFKMLGLPTKYAPLTAVFLGICATLGLSFFEATFSVIISGIVIGLTACGLYSGVKTTIE